MRARHSSIGRWWFRRTVILISSGALALGLVGVPGGVAATSGATQRYLVVFAGTYALDGSYALGGDYALNHAYALEIVRVAGGTVSNDLSKQIGVMVVESSNDQFYALLKSDALVEEIGQDWRWQGFGPPSAPAPEPATDPAESLQWDMQMIRADQAHTPRAVDRRSRSASSIAGSTAAIPTS